jgi:hypothetical protein
MMLRIQEEGMEGGREGERMEGRKEGFIRKSKGLYAIINR